MHPANPSCAVALPRERNNATDLDRATNNATATAHNARKPASLKELRAQLRAQLPRNYSGNREAEKTAELRMPESATAIRAWLAHIEETDPETIAEVLANCRSNTESRLYFLGRAAELTKGH